MSAVGGGLEEGDECHGHEVGTVDVGLVCVHPVGVGNVGVHVLLEFGCVVAFGFGLARGDTTGR